jgi:hypothetical protein
MPINCEIILQWGATPEQVRAVGAALWHWCTRAAGGAGIYHCHLRPPLPSVGHQVSTARSLPVAKNGHAEP